MGGPKKGPAKTFVIALCDREKRALARARCCRWLGDTICDTIGKGLGETGCLIGGFAVGGQRLLTFSE